jgi:hypothetical protein
MGSRQFENGGTKMLPSRSMLAKPSLTDRVIQQTPVALCSSRPQIPAEPASASLRTIALDDSEHFLHNHHASVATLRLLFTFAPECRSASLRNQCSPSPEYPRVIQDALIG